MKKIAIVAGGPKDFVPDLSKFDENNILWIGADLGAEVILEQGRRLDIAVGDFDSVSSESLMRIKESAGRTDTYPNEKNETDLEIALLEALKYQPEQILLFGVTGGRLDHTMVNIQILYPLLTKGIKGTIIDQQNQVELVGQGVHTLKKISQYPYVSFLPVTLAIKGLSLEGFYYPLLDAELSYGSTRCISNQLIEDRGTFSFTEGILLVIRSHDVI
ncbi:thiamine diphosphokinase [Halobacillus naozhouensis]|uniref:Thiamine diphosphokinase n=1 Tax=Halobacillus naozhouensis TaxID=554880 RepID=A0ABY8J2G6_9BACI|nr:thiamine diphosphokinase [Halobacillus naozhouensis]WFT76694.1 thiamine diphosphokinase [Halobacillus naozhouensis]